MPSKTEQHRYIDAENGQTLDISRSDSISIVVARNVRGAFSALPGQEELSIDANVNLEQSQMLLQKYVDLAYRVAGIEERKAAALPTVFRRSGDGIDVLKMWRIEHELLPHKREIWAAIRSSNEKVCLQPQLLAPAVEPDQASSPLASAAPVQGGEAVAIEKTVSVEAETNKTATEIIQMFKGRPVNGIQVEVAGMAPLIMDGPTAKPPEPKKEEGVLQKIGRVVGIDKPARVGKIEVDGTRLMYLSFGYEDEDEGRELARLCHEGTLAVFKLDFQKTEDRPAVYLLNEINLDTKLMQTAIEQAAANENLLCENTTKAA